MECRESVSIAFGQDLKETYNQNLICKHSNVGSNVTQQKTNLYFV